MANFTDVVCQIEPLVLPMVCHPLPPQHVIQSFHQFSNNLRIMRALPGWFAVDSWMVTCINTELKYPDRLEESILTTITPIVCDHLFDLFL